MYPFPTNDQLKDLIQLARREDLGAGDIGIWRELRAKSGAPAHPFMEPEFTLAVGRVRRYALDDGQTLVAGRGPTHDFVAQHGERLLDFIRQEVIVLDDYDACHVLDFPERRALQVATARFHSSYHRTSPLARTRPLLGLGS